MISNSTTRGIENAFDAQGGFVWNRLHSEREEVCEAMAATTRPRELLQSRLRKIDDALDRLFSGSYGHCSKCGKRIEGLMLSSDAATPLCENCSAH